MTTPLTRTKTEAHEALYPELERLTLQMEAMSKRNPAAPVPAATATIAADLLFDAQRFAAVRRGLPEVAADVGGLATQLGRALAQLDAFEAAHAAWHSELKCFAWSLRDPLPVKRLRQQSDSMKTARQKRNSQGRREKSLKHFTARIERAYDEGYEHASAGRPHIGSLPSTSSQQRGGTS